MTTDGWEQRLADLGQARELREAIARWLFGLSNPDRYWDAEWLDRSPIYSETDALLSGPLAPLLAAQAAVERVEALAETWRYKGELGWGAWQEGQGPDIEGSVLDHAASEIRRAVDGPT